MSKLTWNGKILDHKTKHDGKAALSFTNISNMSVTVSFSKFQIKIF